jgi:hypothetical protein
MLGKNRFVAHLNSLGYGALHLPKADVAPRQIFSKDGRDLSRLGELTTILEPGENIPVPEIRTNTRVVNISGKGTGEVDFKLGLSFLGGILQAMGGMVPGLDASYGEAESLSFQFDDVLEDRLEVAELDQYLADAKLNEFSRDLGERLQSSQIYVTTAILKSATITVAASDKKGAGVDVKVPVVQAAVGVEVGVSGSGESSSTITYQGQNPLVFAFQAVRLMAKDGSYRLKQVEKLGMRKGEDSEAEEEPQFDLLIGEDLSLDL